MKKILFVDDEKKIIDGLKRMLHPMRKEWEMYFALSGEEALAIIEDQPIDAIISDMRMPGIDGAELLTLIMKKYPKMIRIVLSGYSEQELILKSVRPTHQYLSKPCSVDILRKTIDRASKLHVMLQGNEIKNTISQMDSLPSQPRLYKAILEKLQDPESSMKDIGKIIESDMGMTVQILKLINSSFFGFYKDITSPVQAATLLGINTIKTLVLSLEIFTIFKTKEPLSEFVNEIWTYSKLSAHFSKLIAREVSDNPVFIEDAFMVGFLHDIGFLILSSKLPDKLIDIINQSVDKNKTIYQVENENIGTTHPQIGAYLLELWGFADDITEAVYNYPDIKHLDKKELSLGHILHLGAGFAHKIHPSRYPILEYKIKKDFLDTMNLKEQYNEWFSLCKKLYESGELE